MAILYKVELSPGKIEAIEGWLPKQPWADVAEGTRLERLSSFRFDDPAGEVGVEFHLVTAPDGTVYQVPLTYRGAPLAGAEEHLVTEMEHPELGHRWVYDGAADPVCVVETLRAVVTGGHSVDEFWKTDSGLVKNDDVADAWGTSAPQISLADLPEGAELDALIPQVEEVGGVTLSVLGEVKLAFMRALKEVTSDALAAPAGQLQVKVGTREFLSARLMS